MKNKARIWEQELKTKTHSYFLCWHIGKYDGKWALIVNDHVLATFERESDAQTFRRFILIPYMKKVYLPMPGENHDNLK